MIRAVVAIPARYASTRLPGKALIDLGGKPLVKHCYDCVKSYGYDVVVLTDDKRIASVIGPDAHIVDGDIDSGTIRIVEANHQGLFDDYTHVINVQGDQPFIDKSWIEDTIEMLDQGADATQLCTDLMPGDIDDPSCTKIVHNGKTVQWISRNFRYGYRAVNIYGFTKKFLQMVRDYQMSPEEASEKVEQLRYIVNGWDYTIKHVDVPYNFVDINLPKDVERWRELNDKLYI